MTDDRIDRLVAALERLVQGAPARRYFVRFYSYYNYGSASCVVEAWSHDDAVKAARVRLLRNGHEPDLVRPALDTDCHAGCGNTNCDPDHDCQGCGRNREQQIAIMRGVRWQ